METTQPEDYGPHLMLRIGSIERLDACRNAELLSGFLVELVRELGMRILSGPCMGYETGDPAHVGHSGVVILYESHAAIHTYPEMRQAFVDIFSCKPFDPAQVFEVLRRYFGGFEVIEENLLSRGVHWQHDARAALTAWQSRK